MRKKTNVQGTGFPTVSGYFINTENLNNLRLIMKCNYSSAFYFLFPGTILQQFNKKKNINHFYLGYYVMYVMIF